MGHPMRIELTRAGLLVYIANHYTTRGAQTPAIVTYILLAKAIAPPQKLIIPMSYCYI